MKLKTLLLTIVIPLLLVNCQQNISAEVGYQPPLIPIRVSINQHGEIALSSSYSINTPIGTFDLTGEYSISDIRREIDYPVLIIRVDNVATVYELEPGNTFDVTFGGNNQFYEQVALRRESNGDIILELTSIMMSDSSPLPLSNTWNYEGTEPGRENASSVDNPSEPVYSDSCSGAFATRLYIGIRAKVVAVPRLVVHELPGSGTPTVHGHSLSNGRTVNILDGPVCDGGMLWWKAESGIITLSNGERYNIVGWMAEESGDEWLLEPLP